MFQTRVSFTRITLMSSRGARDVMMEANVSAFTPAPDELAEIFAAICVKAGATIMDVYDRGAGDVRLKDDKSPVSEADELGEALITGELRRLIPDLPVVAEEACAKAGKPPVAGRYILVDPLDGTREFISRNGEFTVNIALIDGTAPVAGAVYAPALSRLWAAGTTAWGCSVRPGGTLPGRAERRALRTRACPADKWIALASRSHADPATESFLAELPIGDRRAAGSSLKFCVLADSEADVYPRFGTTMEWDTAAGDAVLRAAGGVVLQPDGQPFCYGKPGYKNGPFVAWADPAAVRTSAR